MKQTCKHRLMPKAMKKVFIPLLAATLLLGGCSQKPISPLESWKAGSANDDIFLQMTDDDMNQLIANDLSLLEIDWLYETDKTSEEIATWAAGIKERTDRAGITIWSVHIPFGGLYDISQTDDSLRQNAVAMNLKAMQLSAQTVAPQKFVIHPSAEPISDEERPARVEASKKSLQELAAKAKELGIPLLVENLPRTCLGNTSTELLSIIDGIENTAICFDVNHLLIEPQSVFIQNAKEKIQTTHMSDYDRVNERHWTPGDGIIDWNELLSGLVEVGYKGPFIFEASLKSKDGRTETIQGLGDTWKKLKQEYSN